MTSAADPGRRLWGIVFTLVCALASPLAAQPLPAGNEFRINETTISSQYDPDVAADAAGNFVVVWSSYNQDSDGYSVIGRRYDSSGAPLGSEFLVNTYTTDDQNDSAVAAAPDGRFVVAWVSRHQDGSGRGVFGQRFDANGGPLGTEFHINTHTTGEQRNPSIAVDAAGGFVVAWGDPDDGSYYGIVARRYDSSGVPQAPELQVNSVTAGYQFVPNVAATPAGFIVTWSGEDNVSARRLDSSGVPLGSDISVDVDGDGSADVATTSDGSFVVAWSNYDGDGNGVFARTFDSAGVPLGTELQVSTYTTDDQSVPTVATDSGGGFLVSWRSIGQDGSDRGVFGRGFSPLGEATGPEFQVNQHTTDSQDEPAAANLGGGRFVLVWQSEEQEGGGVFGRRYLQAGQAVTGRKLLIRTSQSHPDGNSLTLVSSDAQLDTPQTDLEDPRCPPLGSGSETAGGRLRVVGAGGDFTINLPCVNWSGNVERTRFRYRDASGATCSSISLRGGRLKAKCRGVQVAYNLGAAQGDVAAILSTGASGKYCTTFGPQASTVVRDGSDGRTYRAVLAGPGDCL